MLLTVTKLQKTGANKLEVGSYGKTRKKKSYTASVNSSCTGATEALQQFQSTKNYIRSNSIVRGLPSHFSSLKHGFATD